MNTSWPLIDESTDVKIVILQCLERIRSILVPKAGLEEVNDRSIAQI
jgi:hypothetical protein